MREKKWDGKINVSQICSSHTLKTIKSGKEFQENVLLEFFIACLLLNINYELFAFKFHLKKVKFRTSNLCKKRIEQTVNYSGKISSVVK